ADGVAPETVFAAIRTSVASVYKVDSRTSQYVGNYFPTGPAFLNTLTVLHVDDLLVITANAPVDWIR
ncbi:MAG: hypothetical protein HY718_03280, partial [Planctomycetes bacterium]|nr:hypothetical protein [Planctomycetota bacterium]